MPIQNDQPRKPWYRQFWPWFLLSIPITSVILSTIMLTVSIRDRDTVVVDNYYKEGRAINEELSKDKFAEELGLGARFQIEPNGLVRIRLHSEQPIAPDHLELKLLHPTLAGRDQQIVLQPQDRLDYVGQLAGNLDGRWYIDIIDDQNLWRLKGEIRLPQDAPLTLGTAPTN